MATPLAVGLELWSQEERLLVLVAQVDHHLRLLAFPAYPVAGDRADQGD